ncbi:unnamed protein product, partial [Effrenium voratum]
MPGIGPPSLGGGMKNTMSLAEYRKRIVELYAIYKPDNVMKVDYLLEKYRGQEEFLYRSICQKYDVDPLRWPQTQPSALPSPLPSQPLPLPPPPPPAPSPGIAPWAAQSHMPLPAVTTRAKMPPSPGPPSLVPTATRAGIGFTPATPATPGPVPAPASTPARQKHEVFEWDPATGKMVATTVEIDSDFGMAQAPSPEEQTNASHPMPLPPPPPPPQASQAVATANDEYDPFAAGAEPEPEPKRPLDLVPPAFVLLLKAVNGAWWEDLNPWAPKSWTGREGTSLGPEYELGSGELQRYVTKVDIMDFSLELFESQFRHQQPVVVMGLMKDWPATSEWTWQKLTDVKGKYRDFQLEKHLNHYFSTHSKNENLFFENLILESPFSEDCPFGSVTQQGDGPKKVLGRNFLPRLNQAWSEARDRAMQEGLLEGDFAESSQGFIIASPA